MPVGDSSELAGRLLSRLPDTARWVETRGSLLTGECELFGDESGCVLRDPGERLLSVIGQVKPCAIRAATDGLEGEWSLICATEVSGAVAGRLPAWAEELAFLHELPMGVVPKAPPVVAALERVERRSAGLLDHLPPSLKAEIARAAGRRPMVAAWLEGRAVSFCYAAFSTETLWDVSVDTLEPHRGCGLAASCACSLIELLEGTGLAPVWGAVESNPASLGLAAKLGFERSDTIALFEASFQPRASSRAAV